MERAPSSAPVRVEQRTLALALLVSLLLWNLPFGGYAMYPFKLLATWLHELSHGLMMLLTGAGFDHVVIYRDTSGLAYARSSVGPIASGLIAAAGYMGTSLWGAVLLVTSRDPRSARRALLVLASLLASTAIALIAPDSSGDMFGPYAVAAIGVVVAICALALPGRWRVMVAHFVAAQSCVNALLDIRVLLRPSQVVGGKYVGISDAHNMAMLTFGTAATWAVWTWAIAWLVWSLAVLFIAIRIASSRAWQDASPVALAWARLRRGRALASESTRSGR